MPRSSSAPADQERAPPPDYCNLGIVLRVLALINAGMLVYAIASSSSWSESGFRVLSIAMVLEPATMLGVFVLCALQRVLASERASRRIALGAVVGFASAWVVSALTVIVLGTDATLLGQRGFGGVALAIVGATVGAGTCWVLELRARAMSPALAAAKLQALQSRIRPHFLFNSLNAAMSLVRTDPARAEHVLEDLSDLFRMLMSDSRDLIALSEEVALARQYLAIEQVRLGERLRVEWEIARMPTDHRVPPLLLQPLLENAVRHGIEPVLDGGVVAVRITGMARELVIVVENSYQPGAVQPGNGLALANVRERLMLVYDLEARMRAEGDGKRYRVVLTLPLDARSAA